MEAVIYPIGIQSFEQLRNYGYAYVDKTEYVYRLVREPKCFFLSRPRRFGKSLLLSTIEAFFSGKKCLFEGLYIYDKVTQWVQYPVLHFDFSRAEGYSTDRLTAFISNRLKEMEQSYGVELNNTMDSVADRFGTLITNIHIKTGKQIVVLIDEYDKGILDAIDDHDILESNQKVLQPFFAQIKALGAYIRFAFITGVARFRHYDIFSGFNNIDDISLDEDYAAVCGITKGELLNVFDSGICLLADKHEYTYDETLEHLRLKYDGYRFSASKVLVFNPFSILNCLSKRRFDNYWVKSGTSRTFVKYLTKSSFDITRLEGIWQTAEVMESTYSADNPVPLLFQTGYLTIKDYQDNLYKLGIPNGEVRAALVSELIPKFMGIDNNDLNLKLTELKKMILDADIDSFMKELTAIVAKIPYHQLDSENIEKTYHLVVYQLFLMIGIETRSEIAMSGGRIDMVAETINYVYVMEFKLGGTARTALKQIDSKGYAIPWYADGRTVYKIGIAFSPKTRTIKEWKFVKT